MKFKPEMMMMMMMMRRWEVNWTAVRCHDDCRDCSPQLQQRTQVNEFYTGESVTPISLSPANTWVLHRWGCNTISLLPEFFEWMDESMIRVIKKQLKASLVLHTRQLKNITKITKTKCWAVGSPWRQSSWSPVGSPVGTRGSMVEKISRTGVPLR